MSNCLASRPGHTDGTSDTATAERSPAREPRHPPVSMADAEALHRAVEREFGDALVALGRRDLQWCPEAQIGEGGCAAAGIRLDPHRGEMVAVQITGDAARHFDIGMDVIGVDA